MNYDDLQKRVSELERTVADLHNALSKINYLAGQIGNAKVNDIVRARRLGLFSQSANPSSGDVGDLVVVGGKLKICSATGPTWTVVGTQS